MDENPGKTSSLPAASSTLGAFSPFVAQHLRNFPHLLRWLDLLRNIWGKFSICCATFEENSPFVTQLLRKILHLLRNKWRKLIKTVKNRCSSKVFSPFLTSTSPLCTKNANSAKKIGSAALFFPLEHCFKSSARYRRFPPPAV